MSLKAKLKAANKANSDERISAEAKRRQQEEDDRQWRLNEFKKELLELPKKLEKYAREGSTFHTIYKTECKDEYYNILEKFASENDLTLSMQWHYQQPESSDPDSGEGGCEGGPVFVYKLEW